MKGEHEILVKGKMKQCGFLYKPTLKQQKTSREPSHIMDESKKDLTSAREEHEQGGNPNLQ